MPLMPAGHRTAPDSEDGVAALLAERSLSPIVVCNASGGIKSASARAKAMFLIDDAISWPDVLGGMPFTPGVRKAIRQDGTEFDLLIERSEIITDRGAVLHILLLTDMSFVDTARDMLLREVSLSETAIEKLPGAVCLRDHRGRIVLANEDFRRIFPGYAPGERSTPGELAGAEYTTAWDESGDAVFRSGQTSVRRLSFDKLQGKTGWIDLISRPVSPSPGLVLGTLDAARDISDDIINYDELDCARIRAEKSAAEYAGKLASASHDMRQPIQAIRTSVESLLLSADEKQRGELIDAIQTCSAELGNIIDGILTQPETPDAFLPPCPRIIPLQNILSTIIPVYGFRAMHAGITLFVGTTDLHVHTDPTLLGRMLRNLVENAIRHTSAGGVSIQASIMRDRVRITVSDTGAGIDPGLLTCLWPDPDNTPEPAPLERGRGLRNVVRFARLLGHELGVDSTMGQGSVFSVTVPLAKPIQMSSGKRQALPGGR